MGLAPVKFLAKIASDMRKPNGVSILASEDIPLFLTTLPVQRIPGVGKRTLTVLQQLGVATAGDVMRYPEEFWTRKLGKFGGELYLRAQGIDNRPVVVEYDWLAFATVGTGWAESAPAKTGRQNHHAKGQI